MPISVRSLSQLSTLDNPFPTAKFCGYSHVTWYVGNAKQAAFYYMTTMGFRPLAHRGLETGTRGVATHVVSNGSAVFVFMSTLQNPASLPDTCPEKQLAEEIAAHVAKHGDAVKDVALEVDNVETVFERAFANGATIVDSLKTISDENGTVTFGVIAAYGDTTHTLITKQNYKGPFLPGFQAAKPADYLELLPVVNFVTIDHCVGNQNWNNMEDVCAYYEKVFGFHKFWSADDSVITTDYSALCSVVMTDPDNKIKIPINEPAKGKGRSQIEEFVKFYDGSGVQHIALQTVNILETIPHMRARGAEFIKIPATYYDNLRKRLAAGGNNGLNATALAHLQQSLEKIEHNNILVDFDERGYLLQLFTKPLADRPTVFIEIIQREGHDGFGAGNFKALFESIEEEQKKRGTLFDRT
jgi:4-hydroxyphenylpyruvate dioxygenase